MRLWRRFAIRRIDIATDIARLDAYKYVFSFVIFAQWWWFPLGYGDRGRCSMFVSMLRMHIAAAYGETMIRWAGFECCLQRKASAVMTQERINQSIIFVCTSIWKMNSILLYQVSSYPDQSRRGVLYFHFLACNVTIYIPGVWPLYVWLSSPQTSLSVVTSCWRVNVNKNIVLPK